MKRTPAIWPPMLSTRERLTLGEMMRGFWAGNDVVSSELAGLVPVAERHLFFTTYGKSAFELAIRTAGLEGKRILLPAFISHDFVGVIKKYNITPLFVDVDLDNFHIELAAVGNVSPVETDAIVVLHTFGLPADTTGLREICDVNNLVLIEDCARALGAHEQGSVVGSAGDYAIYSLSKVAPVRRGGLLVSREPVADSIPTARAGIAGTLNSLLLLRVPGGRAFESLLYRRVKNTPVYQGEVGLYDPPPLEQPERIVTFFLRSFLPDYRSAMARKREIALTLRDRLEPLGFVFQSDPGTHIYTALGGLVPETSSRAALRVQLMQRGVNAYTLWKDPLGTSELARQAWGTPTEAYPNTATLASRLLHFPINRFMRPRDVDRIVGVCERFILDRPTERELR